VAMIVQLPLLLETNLFMIEEAQDAEKHAERAGSTVYSWKTCGRSNWLEKGFSLVDVLGFVVLPSGLPSTVEMPDDPPEETDSN